MKCKEFQRVWFLKPYFIAAIIISIISIIIFIVFLCYKGINKQFCEERQSTLEAVSSKITQSTYTRFDMQQKCLGYSAKILESLEIFNESELFRELKTIEESLEFSEDDGKLYLFDDNGYYYGAEGKIGPWIEQNILDSSNNSSVCVTNLPKNQSDKKEYLLFIHRFDHPQTFNGIVITHIALERNMAIFESDSEIRSYGNIDSSYIIKKDGTNIYHQTNGKPFAYEENALQMFEKCVFEDGVTRDKINQKIQLNQSGSAHMVYNGTDYIISYHPLKIGDWYALYIVSLDSICQSMKKFMYQIVFLVGGAGITLIYLFLLLFNINNHRWHQRQQENNAKLRSAVLESERANNAKSEFLSRMSHDVRTPLNGIIGMTDIAKKSIDNPEKVDNCLQKIVSCSEHLLFLVNDLLDMSLIERGTIEIKSAPFDLIEALGECFYMIEVRIIERNVEFFRDYNGIEHNMVLGDKNHLKQILMNILDNAIKFIRDNGKITFSVIEIDPNSDVPMYRFEITDTGIGMSSEYLEHIFEPFSQENEGARAEYNGTGLGMSIVKNLVDKMKGTVCVGSTKNKGSTFVVYLPFKSAISDDIYTQITWDTTHKKLKGKVLLVEDSALNREIAEYILESAKISYVSVENGQEAVDTFSKSEQGEFSAILMDIMLPIMDGLQATRIIRAMKRPDAKSIPIIAMTANAYREDEEKSHEAGINTHLTKPLDPNIMLKVLNDLIK